MSERNKTEWTPYEQVETDCTREEYEILMRNRNVNVYDYSMCLDCYATRIPSKKDAEGHIERTGHQVVDVYSHPDYCSKVN